MAGLLGTPKFPSAHLVELLWRGYLRTGAEQFNQLVITTLTSMSIGGIYDHIGGGFARYSTDERWLVPHFEKMLYDNALIVDLLTLLYQHNRSRLYRERVEETIGWVLREMMVEQGFASSLDADSEGEEGKYYLWTEAEIDAALMGTYVQRFKDVYSVRREGNYQGRNILHRVHPTLGYPLADADEALLKKQRELLLGARMRTPAPLRDDKVLADWNGMMITALANAGSVFRNTAWTAAAIRAFDFVVQALGDGERLYHSWRGGKRQHTGFADDYAQMTKAALALWESTNDKRYLDQAQDLGAHAQRTFLGHAERRLFPHAGRCRAADRPPTDDLRPVRALRQRHDDLDARQASFRDGRRELSRPRQCAGAGVRRRIAARLHLDEFLSQRAGNRAHRASGRDCRPDHQSQDA